MYNILCRKPLYIIVMDKRNLAFDRTNFILLGIGFTIVVIGFILMSGAGSTEQVYNPDIFSFRRIKVAPVVTFLGFVSMIYAIVRKPKEDVDETLPKGHEKPADVEDEPAK